jgi:hypothetical protein
MGWTAIRTDLLFMDIVFDDQGVDGRNILETESCKAFCSTGVLGNSVKGNCLTTALWGRHPLWLSPNAKIKKFPDEISLADQVFFTFNSPGSNTKDNRAG